MKPVTQKTVRAVSGSSIALSIISILFMLGIVYAVLALLGPSGSSAIISIFALVVLGISTYYFAFSVLSWAYLRVKKQPAAKK